MGRSEIPGRSSRPHVLTFLHISRRASDQARVRQQTPFKAAAKDEITCVPLLHSFSPSPPLPLILIFAFDYNSGLALSDNIYCTNTKPPPRGSCMLSFPFHFSLSFVCFPSSPFTGTLEIASAIQNLDNCRKVACMYCI
jgi:hypothetical protein